MEELIKKLIDKIIDELAEKGRAEIEIRGTLSKHSDKIQDLELILKDKAGEDEYLALKDRVNNIEHWKKECNKKSDNKSKYMIAWIAVFGTAIAGIFELIKHWFFKQ